MLASQLMRYANKHVGHENNIRPTQQNSENTEHSLKMRWGQLVSLLAMLP